MNVILIAVISLGVIALVSAAILYVASKKFAVYEDPRIAQVAEVLPQANCGGCGYPGCSGFADACVKAGSLDGKLCPVGGQPVMTKIAEILGLDAAAAEPMVAVVRCNGTCANRPRVNQYDGAKSCAIAASLYGGETGCSYGCLGCGDCVAACQFDAIVGRGGLLKPIPGGVYAVNDAMLDDMLHAMRTHACNLGCLIAHELAAMLPGCPSFIADPGVVDELDDVARITGSPLMPSITIWHALNQRAIARRYAAERSALQPEAPVHYEDLNLIVCHLGGGVSVGVHRHGRAVDVPNALDGFGPFSPERAGTLPAGQLIDLCHSGRYTTEELKKRISGKAGLAAHLGTTDIPAIERRIAEGDTHAALVLDAMIYRIAKEIGGAAVVLYGKVDAILLTGGMAHSEYITSRLQERVSFLAPVHVYPGEDELEALVMNALEEISATLPSFGESFAARAPTAPPFPSVFTTTTSIPISCVRY